MCLLTGLSPDPRQLRALSQTPAGLGEKQGTRYREEGSGKGGERKGEGKKGKEREVRLLNLPLRNTDSVRVLPIVLYVVDHNTEVDNKTLKLGTESTSVIMFADD